MAGKVVVGDHTQTKPGTRVARDIPVRLRGQDHGYASRGGLKLRGALDQFPQVVTADRVAMDIGASTGGFSDCLLQAGVAKVFAIDVGYGQLAWKIAQDPRVVSIERQNIRHLEPAQVEPIGLAVIDCSFISLTKVLPSLPKLLVSGADVVALIKPQFEVGRQHIHKGGIVREASAREAARMGVAEAAKALGFEVCGECASPITGRDGNHEFFIWLRWP